MVGGRLPTRGMVHFTEHQECSQATLGQEGLGRHYLWLQHFVEKCFRELNSLI
jgi:hypothetical protein